jgi:hypothetical protein
MIFKIESKNIKERIETTQTIDDPKVGPPVAHFI